jgi:hypothetical protein
VDAAAALESLIAAAGGAGVAPGPLTGVLAEAASRASRARVEAARLTHAAEALALATPVAAAAAAATAPASDRRRGVTFAPPELLLSVREF